MPALWGDAGLTRAVRHGNRSPTAEAKLKPVAREVGGFRVLGTEHRPLVGRTVRPEPDQQTPDAPVTAVIVGVVSAPPAEGISANSSALKTPLAVLPGNCRPKSTPCEYRRVAWQKQNGSRPRPAKARGEEPQTERSVQRRRQRARHEEAGCVPLRLAANGGSSGQAASECFYDSNTRVHACCKPALQPAQLTQESEMAADKTTASSAGTRKKCNQVWQQSGQAAGAAS